MAALRKAATIQKATGEDDWRDDGITTIEESEKVRRRTSESHENEHTTGQGRESARVAETAMPRESVRGVRLLEGCTLSTSDNSGVCDCERRRQPGRAVG